jgi:DNA-directed RNA polymerase subunit N (RpoN/RPB10)
MRHPIRCENGCGAVIELSDAFRSYKKKIEDGEELPLLVCECCAAEEGHLDEDLEEPEESPVCRRKPKKQL